MQFVKLPDSCPKGGNGDGRFLDASRVRELRDKVQLIVLSRRNTFCELHFVKDDQGKEMQL